jgi:hypothetical protein
MTPKQFIKHIRRLEKRNLEDESHFMATCSEMDG